MRVFYIDEEDLSKRRYYVKLDNVSIPDRLKGYKAIDADTVDELKSVIMEVFELKRVRENSDKERELDIQIWTGQNCMGKRLDILKDIPKEIEFVYARVITNKVD
jgi:hypothetical protein